MLLLLGGAFPAQHADAGEFLRGGDRTAWYQWREVLLRSPAEYEQAKADEGEITPYTDPRLVHNEATYAKFLA